MTIRCPICGQVIYFSLNHYGTHCKKHKMSNLEFSKMVRAHLAKEAKKLITNHA